MSGAGLSNPTSTSIVATHSEEKKLCFPSRGASAAVRMAISVTPGPLNLFIPPELGATIAGKQFACPDDVTSGTPTPIAKNTPPTSPFNLEWLLKRIKNP